MDGIGRYKYFLAFTVEISRLVGEKGSIDSDGFKLVSRFNS